jgi:spermidine synthase
MPTDSWVNETLYPEWGQRFLVKRELARVQSDFQDIMVFESYTHGRVLMLDGVVQSIDYVRKAADGSFDVVIVDSTDPIGVGEVLFTDEFYANVARLLSDKGVIVNQCGVPAMQADELHDTSLRRAKSFSDIFAYVAAVPTYVGGFMTLGWSAKDASLRQVDTATIRARAEAAGILGKTQYWTPEIHTGAFHLPPYIAKHLPQG